MKNIKQLLFLSILCSLALFTNCGDMVGDSSQSLIYLDENGITIKAYENAVVGESYGLNGINYLVVDSAMLYQMVDENEDVSKVVTTKITRMLYLFSDSVDHSFNQDIGAWDVGNVTDMSAMFFGAESFNRDISAWDVSNVTTMYFMFGKAESFNQDISSWDVSHVINMFFMFSNAESFNQDISSWDVSNVTECSAFRFNATSWTEPKPNFTNCTE
ncbi:MAG: BspA family leucine-rich repeat surface protein [Cyclobacteriaceae bacterium]|nr:BspA family leucine-rich repeat surface protein [Cyclobacteriaceae bacterium]